ncbi:uncharacterized protein LOC113315711 [Papaver somniferum]|uniref:uncharacterized protein LOC113315711 n=1 Tax=Papaver somniferum TaxID=3469 RepID=UPI000E6FE390|nr:uncharacterized protein LOC113315711 [Papaver somniferum]
MGTNSNSAAQMGNSSDFVFPFTNISNFVSTKLGPNNFLLWRDQMETILISTDLYGYVNGEIQEPARQATFTDSVSGDVLGLSSARQIWELLEINFRIQFMARKNMLRNQLHNFKKGNLTILVYLHNVKNIADSLAAIGEKVSDIDLVMYVLNGLGREFDTFVIAAQNRENLFSFTELKPRLLNHEQWLLEQQTTSNNIYDTHHQYAFYSKNGNTNTFSGNGRGKSKNNGNFNGNFKPNSDYSSRNTGNGYYQGSTSSQGNGFYQGSTSSQGNGSSSQGNGIGSNGGRRYFSSVDCQICRKKGHYASKCYFRYHPPTFSNSANEAHRANPQQAFTTLN